jgi:hypothetical protein
MLRARRATEVLAGMVLLWAQSCYASHEGLREVGPPDPDADAAVDAGPWPDVTLGPSCPSRVPTLRVPLEECESILMHPGASSALLECSLGGGPLVQTDLALVIPHPDAAFAVIYFESLAPLDRRSCDPVCGLSLLGPYRPDPLRCACGDDRGGTQAPPAGRDPETGEPRPELLASYDLPAFLQLASFNSLELRVWGCSDDVRPPGFLP